MSWMHTRERHTLSSLFCETHCGDLCLHITRCVLRPHEVRVAYHEVCIAFVLFCMCVWVASNCALCVALRRALLVLHFCLLLIVDCVSRCGEQFSRSISVARDYDGHSRIQITL